MTDPFATAVDYRSVKYASGSKQPSSVIKLDMTTEKLVPCDPDGATPKQVVAPSISSIPKNHELVIYELPVSWTKADSAEIEA